MSTGTIFKKLIHSSVISKSPLSFPVGIYKSRTLGICCRSIVTSGQDLSLNEAAHKPNSKRKILRIGVQGAGFDRGQPKPGVETGPEIIRSSGFVEFLRNEVGHDVVDFGDINFGLKSRKSNVIENKHTSSSDHFQLRNVTDVGNATRLISENTSKIVTEGRICLTLGGDHSIAIGTINGVSQVVSDLAVLWVDAHTDINTPATTTSGNMHGMSVAFLLKELQSSMIKLPEFSWVTPRISASNIAYIGLRSVDPGEREILDRLGITAFSMRDVDRLGIVEVTRRALEKISPGGTKPCHVSFDIDSLDDLEVGNTGTPVAGGLTLREGMTLLEEVQETVNVISMDLVEVNPLLGDSTTQGRTSAITKHLLGSAFGYCRGGLYLGNK